MSDILADLARMQKKPGTTCRLVRLRTEDPEMAAQFDRAAASQYAAPAIARWFTDHGIVISDQFVRRHRNGGCESCRTS